MYFVCMYICTHVCTVCMIYTVVSQVASVGAFTHTVPGKGSGNNSNSSSSANKLASYGIDELVDLIKNTVRIPKRNTKV